MNGMGLALSICCASSFDESGLRDINNNRLFYDKCQSTRSKATLDRRRIQKTEDVALFDRICKQADIVLNLIPHMQERIQQDEPQNAAQYPKMVFDWKHVCIYGKTAGVLWTEPDITILDQRLPDTSECSMSLLQTSVIIIYLDIGLQFRSFNKQFESSEGKTVLTSCSFRVCQKLEIRLPRSPLMPPSPGLPWFTAVHSPRHLSSVSHHCSETPFWNVTVCHRRPGISNTVMFIDGTILFYKGRRPHRSAAVVGL